MRGIDKILEVDGVRIDCTDGSYVLVRVSGTEPKARVYIGAKKQSTVDKLAALAKGAMSQALKELQ